MTILDAARDGMNLDIRPQDDLFGHVNGRWLEDTEIPSDKSSWGAFIALADAAEQQVRDIITELADRPADQLDDDERKIGDLFASFMDTETIAAKGLPVPPTYGAAQELIDSFPASEFQVNRLNQIAEIQDGDVDFDVVGITNGEAKQVIASFLAANPEVQAAWEAENAG